MPLPCPYSSRAIHLDPNFAMAYAALSAVYGNLGEKNLARENSQRRPTNCGSA